jgi:chromate transporter
VKPDASPLQIFFVFLRLGLTSFGGPIAHIAYFRAEFVARRRWLDESGYADLLALCQFIPGPASSQAGFALGVMRGGLWGGIAAWAGFTLPSAGLMLLAAYGAALLSGPSAAGLIHGLKIAAVAVVAQAVWSMSKSLCPDRERASIAVLATAAVLTAPSVLTQLAVIIAGAIAGMLLCKTNGDSVPAASMANASANHSVTALALFGALLAGLPLLGSLSGWSGVNVFEAFYRAGALVFGGGHVVLPLLQQAVVPPGWISEDEFLAGYGAAQALPGPLFAFAAYLGARLHAGPGGVLGGALCLTGLFLPGMLLLYGVLPFWERLRRKPMIRTALMGVNAAVVGILGAALYSPIWISTITRPADLAPALLAFAGLVIWRLPVWLAAAAAAMFGLMCPG